MEIRELDAQAAAAHPALGSDLELGPLLRGRHRDAQRAREAARAAAAVQGGGVALAGPTSLLLVRARPWDTAHFGRPCADIERLYAPEGAPEAESRALLDAAVGWARRGGVALLTARIRARQRGALGHLLRQPGFALMDTSVEIGGVIAPGDAAGTRAATVADLGALRAIAVTFEENRFHRDPRIPAERARAVYARWVESALGEPAPGGVVVVEADGEVVGLATLAAPRDRLPVGTVGLVTMRPDARGRGLVGRLVRAAAARLGTPYLCTGTQLTNAPALRAFGRAGMLPFAARHVLHGWLDARDAR